MRMGRWGWVDEDVWIRMGGWVSEDGWIEMGG